MLKENKRLAVTERNCEKESGHKTQANLKSILKKVAESNKCQSLMITNAKLVKKIQKLKQEGLNKSASKVPENPAHRDIPVELNVIDIDVRNPLNSLR